MLRTTSTLLLRIRVKTLIHMIPKTNTLPSGVDVHQFAGYLSWWSWLWYRAGGWPPWLQWSVVKWTHMLQATSIKFLPGAFAGIIRKESLSGWAMSTSDNYTILKLGCQHGGEEGTAKKVNTDESWRKPSNGRKRIPTERWKAKINLSFA